MKALNRLLEKISGVLCYHAVPSHQISTKIDEPLDVISEKPRPNSNIHGLQGRALTLATDLDGKTLHIPDLKKRFAQWPVAANKHVKELEGLVNSLLERIITNERKLKALKNADFARLIALWYPDAEWPELQVATAYSVWIFVWDDEIDANDTAASTDEEVAYAYYKQSLNYVHHMLGLGTRAANQNGAPDKAPNINMALFSDVGRALSANTDLKQRQRFFGELENFMLQVSVEHTHRMAGTIPTVEEYMDIRSGSVGCGPQIAITDFMLKVRLPESVMESGAMKSLWRETIHICLLLNDIYSVQKEIAQGSLLNVVPVLFENAILGERNLAHVSREIEALFERSIKGFEDAAKALSEMEQDNAVSKTNIQSFIKWNRYFITGVLYWSLESRRYGMAQCVQPDGSLAVVL